MTREEIRQALEQYEQLQEFGDDVVRALQDTNYPGLGRNFDFDCDGEIQENNAGLTISLDQLWYGETETSSILVPWKILDIIDNFEALYEAARAIEADIKKEKAANARRAGRARNRAATKQEQNKIKQDKKELARLKELYE